ncbi:hypothetical protein CSUI_004434 [Cystoisospora suis]|uniref:Uncharacterized protein n=1 Tax=Cystoisospora suis TaxID=483139 RepID=A0A2C6KYS9_9APIC|nr:hypothetical protein CSUI_004434 [Cystoisospora suis]
MHTSIQKRLFRKKSLCFNYYRTAGVYTPSYASRTEGETLSVKVFLLFPNELLARLHVHLPPLRMHLFSVHASSPRARVSSLCMHLFSMACSHWQRRASIIHSCLQPPLLVFKVFLAIFQVCDD